jgi:hypothetical protein
MTGTQQRRSTHQILQEALEAGMRVMYLTRARQWRKWSPSSNIALGCPSKRWRIAKPYVIDLTAIAFPFYTDQMI